jgi:hypothetical protein
MKMASKEVDPATSFSATTDRMPPEVVAQYASWPVFLAGMLDLRDEAV